MSEIPIDEPSREHEELAALLKRAIGATEYEAASKSVDLLAPQLLGEYWKNGRPFPFAWWLGFVIGIAGIARPTCSRTQLKTLLFTAAAAIDEVGECVPTIGSAL